MAPGVYVQRGSDEAASMKNRGAIGNLGVLVGAHGVIVINTGSSAEHGAALLDAVARLTKLPVVLAIDTQATPDQVLGNSAFTRRGIPVLAHRDTNRFMRENCTACIAAVRQEAANAALDATPVAWPTRLIDGSQTIKAGGRALQIIYAGWTERPGCIAVFDPQSGVLFSGEMASFGVVPQAQLARLPAWIDALDQLAALHPTWVVPAHGAPAPASQLAQVREYLRSLLQQVQAAYGRGQGLMETEQTLELPQFHSWALYSVNHHRNVHAAYLQVEQQDLSAP